jgi:hypothetical protein
MVKGVWNMKKLICALLLLCSTSSFSGLGDNWNEKLLLEYKDYTGAVLGAMANYHIRCGGISALGGDFIERAVAKHSFDVERMHLEFMNSLFKKNIFRKRANVHHKHRGCKC